MKNQCEIQSKQMVATEIAQYHFYLTQAVLENIPDDEDGIGDVFGYGEDTLVYALFRLSTAWYYYDEVRYKENSRPDDITVLYAFPEYIALQFWAYIKAQINDKAVEIQLPDTPSFIDLVKRIYDGEHTSR
ncbi:hypothetical protein C9J12_21040 [Photobacterium frigidiphilum]|uniref:Uncharacterized protein n=1 Tax=Photobacterium frigidiphilum TaxID=264736 RepID=A0A2T3JA79_9GAMM|nr:hypothetical protein [Photobacterium frigidiphilum]PSU45731.1 hypothetical protein C9J12_21040 [Photobacterium frigidiphilum]